MSKPKAKKLISPSDRIHESELASLAGLTTRRLRQIADDGKMPQPVGGMFPAAESIAKLIGQARLVGDEMKQARLGKCKAEETLLKIQIEAECKRLIPLDWVLKVWTGVLIEARTIVMDSMLSNEEKKRLLESLTDVQIERYFEDCKPQEWMEETPE